MPASYGKARGSKGLLSLAEVEGKLTEARNYWIITSGPRNRPHAMPVWGLWLDHVLVFSTDPKSRKGRNMARQPEIVAHLESGDDVVILRGKVERVGAKDPIWQRIPDLYERKYKFRPQASPSSPFYALEPDSILAWTEKDFVNSRTAWRRA